MKVRFLGEDDPIAFLHGKVYEVLSIEEGWYRIVDEEGVYEDDEVPGYLFPPELFEVAESDDNERSAGMVGKKVHYIGEYDTIALRRDKTYEVLAVKQGFYRLADELDSDYLYAPGQFEVVGE